MDIREIRKTLEVFKGGELVEIRQIGKYTMSGYFKDYKVLVDAISQYPNETFYFVMNTINDQCYAKEQHEQLMVCGKKMTTTSDNDITCRDWILIDADPKRTSNVSASDVEKEKAKSTIGRVHNYLRDMGFSTPVIADSGNGYHLLYKVIMDCEEEAQNSQTVKRFLQALDMMFSDEFVSIDTTVFNPSRITKLYGTIACKGANTADRPHRVSKILKVPDEVKPTSYELFEKVAKLLPEPEKPSFRNNHGEAFDLQGFIHKHGIRVHKAIQTQQGAKYLLEECPFDSNHKSPDSALFQYSNGALGFKCFHNSCSDKAWKDVRRLFEPQAYNKYDEQQRTDKPQQTKPYKPPTEIEKPDAPKFLTMKQIKPKDRSKIVTIRTGTVGIDSKMYGMNKGEVSILSGGNGSGKSTWISQVCLEAVNRGFKLALFTGELQPWRVKDWMYLQAAGRQFTKPIENFEGAFRVSPGIPDLIDDWLENKIWLYNNDHGWDNETVISAIMEHVKQFGTDLLFIDNLMMVEYDDIRQDEYKMQFDFLYRMTRIAKKTNTHIAIVCHPKKPTGFLRKDDIFGSSKLTNVVDNVFMVHRVNRDFEHRAGEFLGKIKVDEMITDGYTNVIEIMKNRDMGVQDVVVGLYFEQESKRLLNERHENKMYGWIEQEPTTQNPDQWLDDLEQELKEMGG